MRAGAFGSGLGEKLIVTFDLRSATEKVALDRGANIMRN